VTAPFDAVGYSNGANMAVSLLFRYPVLIGDLVLLRPMVPFEPDGSLDLSGRRVLISAGSNDPIVDPSEPVNLHRIMSERGARVDVVSQPTGHSINRAELEAAREWYESRLA
jgi:phospholipase/carboxylesterase